MASHSSSDDASTGSSGSKWKTLVFAFLVIFSNAVGNFFIAWGMKHLGESPNSPAAFVRTIFTPWVGLGVALLIVWLLSRMMFLSFADLSYMLPITSLGYVASALLGKFFLGETITPQRWGGTLLIMGGTMLVGAGKPETAQVQTAKAVSAGEDLP
jgi:drug/metabolite transporter (DMT)-like permease